MKYGNAAEARPSVRLRRLLYEAGDVPSRKRARARLAQELREARAISRSSARDLCAWAAWIGWPTLLHEDRFERSDGQ